jgi:hypothetical protein
MKLAAAVLAAGLSVAACGQVRMGAAAIVGSQRISSTTLSDEVANLNAGYQANKRQIQLQFPASQMPQQVLSWIVRFRVRDQLAAREGISVTPSDELAAKNQIINSIKQSGETATLTEVAVANGLPPDLLTALERYQAIETKLLNRLDGGKLPSASAAQQSLETQFNTTQCRAAKSLDIQINPQYGALNYSDFSVVLVPSSLAKAQSSAPTPAASRPVLTPPC